MRILGLDDGGGDPADLVRATGVLPVRAGGLPGTVRHVLATELLVDLQERAARVGGVQLEDVVLLAIVGHREAHAQLVAEAGLAGRVLVALQDDHVAAVALAPVEVAARGGVLLDRGDDLDELVADRHDGVVEAEHVDARIVEGDVDAELGLELVDDAVTVAGDEGDLAEAEHAVMLALGPSVAGSGVT
ncbi:MAG: hypothetical protein QM686_14785 [Herbaspirillum sp.]